MAKEQITVLLAAYQGERFIRAQLDSILSQTVPGIHILVSDDGSKDQTREILEEYRRNHSDRIILNHRTKEGVFADRSKQIPSAAMNFFWLLSQAEGDYVMLSDQDDVWKPEKTRVLLGKMKELEQALGKEHPILVHSDMEVVNQDLKRMNVSFFAYQNINPNRESLSEVLVENPVTGGAVMMNRALVKLAQAVPKSCCMHDWWIALTAAAFGTIAYVPDSLYLYRQHDENVMGAKQTGSVEDLRKRMDQKEEVRETYWRMFAQAKAFKRVYGEKMNLWQKETLRAFLALPYQTPFMRLKNIMGHHFVKSSAIQTFAQCFTIPSRRR